MKTLMAYYRERETTLRSAMDAAPTLEAAVQILHQELAWLESVVSGDLTLPQQRALMSMFEIVRGSLRGLKDGVRLEHIPQPRTFLYAIAQALLGLVGLGASSETAPSRARWRVRVDTGAYLQHFSHSLEMVDRWLADQPTAAPQTDRRDLLEFLQRLMGDAHTGDTGLLLERLESLPQLMERDGMRFVFYDASLPSRSPSARRLFKFEASLDARLSQPQTLMPAVVQGDEVLFRGLVVEPATVGARTTS
jgi:hypothetical protein